MLKRDDEAPVFELPSATGGRAGEPLGPRSFPGKYVVVYFYPRDNTPGCTREAQAFQAGLAKIRAAGAVVLGVSRDSVTSHCSFGAKYGLGFALLSDPDLRVHRAFGAWGEKTMYGKKVEGTIRSTFILDPRGRVARAFPSVKVDQHFDEVLAALHELAGGAPAASGGAAKAASAKVKKTAAKKKPAAKKSAPRAKTARVAKAAKATKAAKPASKKSAPKKQVRAGGPKR